LKKNHLARKFETNDILQLSETNKNAIHFYSKETSIQDILNRIFSNESRLIQIEILIKVAQRLRKIHEGYESRIKNNLIDMEISLLETLLILSSFIKH
jgi:hypothetical protein